MAGRIAILPDHGAVVLGPPVKWRPRPLTTKEKLEIVVRQHGKEPGGARLNPLDADRLIEILSAPRAEGGNNIVTTHTNIAGQ